MAFDTAEDRFRLEADARYLMFLVQAGELLSSSLDYNETLKNVCRAAVTTVADICIIDLGEAGDTQLVAAAHRDSAETNRIFDEHAGSHLQSAPGRPIHPVCEVIKTGETFYAPQIDDAWIDAHATRPEHAAFMRSMHYASVLVVPIRSVIYGVTGALTLVTTKDGRPPFGDDAMLFAEDLGRRCGSAIGKARIHSEAVDTAMKFQQAALPHALPGLADAAFDVLYEPAASSLLVGGDWYDAFVLPDGRIAISIGDVEGHGLEAAVLMASTKNSLRTALVAQHDLLRALEACDYVFRSENQPDHFCTAMLAIYDPQRRALTCAPAGHPGPKIWSPSKAAVLDPFGGRGLPIGARDLAEPVPPSTIFLEKGALVVFYTDGLIERDRDPLAGDALLESAIERSSVREAARPAHAIYEAVIDGAAAADDVAILTLQIK